MPNQYTHPPRIALNCQQCGVEFKRSQSRAKARYCSVACRTIGQITRADLTCEECGMSFSVTACRTMRRGRQSAARFCSIPCASQAKRVRTSLVGRFWSLVTRGDECWEWRGARTVHGYGVIRRDGESTDRIYAHRVAWWLATGHWPAPDEFVCHDCPDGDNPACVRHDTAGVHIVDGVEYEKRGHLWLGDKISNMRDMHQKGRARTNVPRPPERILWGETASWSKLTQAQVTTIKALCHRGRVSQRVIARHYGVSQSLISLLHLGQRWNDPTA